MIITVIIVGHWPGLATTEIAYRTLTVMTMQTGNCDSQIYVSRRKKYLRRYDRDDVEDDGGDGLMV